MKNYFKNSYKRKNRQTYGANLFIATVTMAVILALFFEKPLAAGEIVPWKNIQTTSKVSSYSEPVYKECVYIYDDTLEAGKREIDQEEIAGSRKVTVMQTYYKGMEMESKIIDSQVVKEPQPKVIRIGTYVPPEYIEPVSDYVITSEFGPRWGKNHNGVDLAVCMGTEVKATADGVVVRADWYSNYGICVDIDHGNGVMSRYAHLSSALVSEGQHVSQGECIALSGSTGYSTGPHLHFELQFDGTAKDPLDYMEPVDL